MARFEKRDPKTKEDFVNRILSYDFDGDIRRLGQGDAKLERTGSQSFRITFSSGKTFELVVRIPRDAPATLQGARPAEEKPPAVEPEAPRQEVRPRRSRTPQVAAEERTFTPAEGSQEAEEGRQEVRGRGRYVRRSQQAQG